MIYFIKLIEGVNKIMTNAISGEKIRNIVKNEIESALGEFLIRMKLELLPYVSREEQEEIENLHGKGLSKNDEEDIAVSRKLGL